MAYTAKSNALISYDEYLTLLGIDSANINLNQDRLTMLIDSASQQIEDYCHRKFIKPSSALVEMFDGDGTSEYYVRHRRIATGTTPTFEYRRDITWTNNDADVYPITVDNDIGKVWFTKFNRTFWGGKANWRITYYYGWTQANLPIDLKTICAEIVKRHQALLDGKEGLASESFGDSTTSYNFAALPENIKMVLDKYRAVNVG